MLLLTASGAGNRVTRSVLRMLDEYRVTEEGHRKKKFHRDTDCCLNVLCYTCNAGHGIAHGWALKCMYTTKTAYA